MRLASRTCWPGASASPRSRTSSILTAWSLSSSRARRWEFGSSAVEFVFYWRSLCSTGATHSPMPRARGRSAGSSGA
eukprot:7259986-Pyramimonas_sp.AAC.1